MRLLLDTHVVIWCIKKDDHLSQAARSKIAKAAEVYVSSASIWEAAIKSKLKKLNIDLKRMIRAIEDAGYQELPITSRHAAAVFDLGDHHNDPFDRILIAQAICEPLTLLTADEKLKNYSDLIEVI